jgi:hypothetical protein
VFKNYAELDFGDGPQAAVAPKSAMFSPHGVDTFSALGKVKFMDIPETELYQFFSDGRITGLLTDQMLNARYKNLSAMRSGNNKGFDLYQNAGDGATPHKPFLWETKVWTKHGCDLAPSGMKGKNRKYNEDEFNANANTLTGGFIVVDIRNFPIMRVFGITAEKHAELGRPRKVTDDIFHRILKGPVGARYKSRQSGKDRRSEEIHDRHGEDRMDFGYPRRTCADNRQGRRCIRDPSRWQEEAAEPSRNGRRSQGRSYPACTSQSCDP